MNQCAYADCNRPIPDKYGEPGVSMSRHDNKSLICSNCGLHEAVGNRHPLLLIKTKKARKSKPKR